MTIETDSNKHVRYEVASERRTLREYSLIPESDPAAIEQDIWDHLLLLVIQRHALNGVSEGVKELLQKFPESKREDLSTMLQKSAAEKGKILEL